MAVPRIMMAIALGLMPAVAVAQGFGTSPSPAPATTKPSPTPAPAATPAPAPTPTPTPVPLDLSTDKANPAAPPTSPAPQDTGKSRKPQLVNDMQPAFDAIKAKDWAGAEKLLAPKAAARDPRAQFLLGAEVYGNKDSKLYDLKKAVPLLKDSSERGFARSMLVYGLMHADGVGLPKDLVEAYKWTALASRRGVPEAGPFLAALANDMPADQIDRAKAAADKFAPRR